MSLVLAVLAALAMLTSSVCKKEKRKSRWKEVEAVASRISRKWKLLQNSFIANEIVD